LFLLLADVGEYLHSSERYMEQRFFCFVLKLLVASMRFSTSRFA